MARATKKATETTTTRETRFEFARRHLVKQMKLETELHEASKALFDWESAGMTGYLNLSKRKPKSPEERAELRELEVAIVDLRTKLLLHENDGREL